MQAIERRSPGAPRIPLDLWVRLNHEDYEADFDADGVDLSMGGLALRSDYLPEVGDRLRCRFDAGAAEIEVDGEVVWAHDVGERQGEFGLRFTGLEQGAHQELQELVEELGGESTGGRVRLHLEGVRTPIEGDLIERDDEWMTVEQELSFLELGMGVATEGTQGRLASVDLRIEQGIPRLVLGVEVLGTPEIAEGREEIAPTAPDTVDEPPADAEPATFQDEALEAANDATMQDVMLADALAEAVEEAPEPEARDEVQVFSTSTSTEADEAPAPEAIEEAPRQSLGQRAAPALAATKAFLATHLSKLGPSLGAFWAKVVALSKALWAKAGPGLKAFGGKLGAFGGVVWAKAKKGRGKRRTTAAVPKKRVAQAPRRRQRGTKDEAPPRRKNRRVIVLSALAFLAVGAAVYAFAGGEDAEAEAPEPAVETEPAAEAAPAPAPAAAPAPAPMAAPAPAAEAAPAEAEAAPEPAPEGGPLAEPSYPTLRDANPANGGPVSEGAAFGADNVSEGRSATLRMSQPVTTIQGQAQDGGFSVTVPGALALDRAAPIAAANPSVERAMILNRGDHAVLTVRFVAGRNPAYRVVARGRAIEVIVGR